MVLNLKFGVMFLFIKLKSKIFFKNEVPANVIFSI